MSLWIAAASDALEIASPTAAIQQLVARLPHVRLVEAGSRPWLAFRQVFGGRHLLFSPAARDRRRLLGEQSVLGCVDFRELLIARYQ